MNMQLNINVVHTFRLDVESVGALMQLLSGLVGSVKAAPAPQAVAAEPYEPSAADIAEYETTVTAPVAERFAQTMEAEKPKRARRTKEQIEADKAAKAVVAEQKPEPVAKTDVAQTVETVAATAPVIDVSPNAFKQAIADADKAGVTMEQMATVLVKAGCQRFRDVKPEQYDAFIADLGALVAALPK